LEAFVMKGRQQGIALPVALIMFVVMLISALYIMRSATMATVATGNLAYQRAISRATDFGIESAYTWLTNTAATSKGLLDADSAGNGYVASYPFTGPNTPATYLDAAFWQGSATTNLTDASGTTLSIEYVVHRYCVNPGPYNAAGNSCVMTTPSATSSTGVVVGTSQAADADLLLPPAMVHYVVTARVTGGAKGASDVNESVVMIGT
jgi:hypothetical protein